MKKILVLGDSLTQRGFDVVHRGWLAQLANAYSGRYEIVSRGFSGKFHLHIVPKLLPD
jgi:hypothetical protein